MDRDSRLIQKRQLVGVITLFQITIGWERIFKLTMVHTTKEED